MEQFGRLLAVIGAMKAGTTSLFHYLAAHPEVCPTRIKEASFFSDDDRYERGLDWYRAQFDWDPALHAVHLDASPNYSKVRWFPHSVDRFKVFPGDVRFVYLVRDPISQIESHYAHARAKGWPQGDPKLADGVRPSLLHICEYATQVRPYVSAFGAPRVRIVRFEDLVAGTEAVVQDICEFADIGVHPNPAAVGVAYNSRDSRVATGTLVRRLRRTEITRRAARLVPKPVRDALERATAEHPEDLRLPDAQRAQVKAELRDELRALRDEFGVDLTGWQTAE